LKRIPKPPAFDDNPNLIFSFGHLDLDSNAKFSLALCEDGYLESLLTRLRDVSNITLREFRNLWRKGELRNHPIAWHETSEPDGFPLDPQLKEEEAWQFELKKNEYGRVHGVLIDQVFHVVWLDPKHRLYPRLPRTKRRKRLS
jgi:hypothetical protein